MTPAPLPFDYAHFAERFRGSEDYVKAGLGIYRAHFAACANVLDIGCGRGEFLEMMREMSIPARGIDLSAPLARWLTSTQARHGEDDGRRRQAIDAHFDRLRPTCLMLDEDAKPMARAAVAAARRRGIPSIVVQHGVPVRSAQFWP